MCHMCANADQVQHMQARFRTPPRLKSEAYLHVYTGIHGQHCKTVEEEAHHCHGLSSIGELLHVQVGGGRWAEQGRWRLFGGAGPAACARPLHSQLAPRCELGLRRWR